MKLSRAFKSTAICLLLALATLAVYWQVGGCSFINYDDQDYVTENRIVRGGLTGEGLAWAFSNPYAFHPVTWLSHMVDCQFFGLSARAHHLTNLSIHIANTLLLFLLLYRMTGAMGRSAFVAGMFALHPLHVESVAWIAERKGLLSAFFSLLTVWAYLNFLEKRKATRYLLMSLCFALALMAKSMAVTLPFVLLLVDYWPLGRLEIGLSETSERGRWLGGFPETVPTLSARRRLPRLIWEKLPLLVLSGVSCALTFLYQRNLGERPLADSFSITARLSNAIISYIRYLVKTSNPQKLSILYPFPGEWPFWQVLGAGLLLLSISTAVLVFRKRFPYLVLGWFWFFGSLVPVIGLAQANVEGLADRYTYIPLIGLFIILTWAGSNLASVQRLPRAAVALWLAGCVTAAWLQLQHWRDSVTLFKHTVAVTSNNPIADYFLGQALSTLGRFDESLPHYQRALRLRPQFPEAHNNWALTLVKLGRAAEATNHFEQALRWKPGDEVIHFNYGVALAALGQPEMAISQYQRALELASALRNADLTSRLDADFFDAHLQLGLALMVQGRLEAAIVHLTKAVQLRPASAEAHAKLGIALSANGRPSEAAAQYRKALSLKADSPEVLNNLAWILATDPDSDLRNASEAVRLAERACELSRQQKPVFLGTLAAAYAEAGRFEDAIKTGQRAYELALEQGEKELANRNQELLQLYKSGRRYRDQK